jgi:hypothetical protein
MIPTGFVILITDTRCSSRMQSCQLASYKAYMGVESRHAQLGRGSRLSALSPLMSAHMPKHGYLEGRSPSRGNLANRVALHTSARAAVRLRIN